MLPQQKGKHIHDGIFNRLVANPGKSPRNHPNKGLPESGERGPRRDTVQNFLFCPAIPFARRDHDWPPFGTMLLSRASILDSSKSDYHVVSESDNLTIRIGRNCAWESTHPGRGPSPGTEAQEGSTAWISIGYYLSVEANWMVITVQRGDFQCPVFSQVRSG
jgi:hypothetical protein